MSEKNIDEMTIDELIAEFIKQYEIASNARRKAEIFESDAVEKFLAENSLDGVVLHKPSGKKGVLRQNRNPRRLEVEFYPLKKNGEESMNKSWNCTVWNIYEEIKQNFENLLKAYE